MAEKNPPLWLQNLVTHTAENERQLPHALFGGRSGVLGRFHMIVAQRSAGANMSVDVGSGRAVIIGSDNVNQGAYHVWNDATVNKVIAAAPGAGQTRIDLVVARVEDAFYAGSNNQWSIAIVTGTAAATGSQVAPAAPSNSIILAQVTVGPSVSSITNANIADVRPRAATLGGTIVCLSTSRPSHDPGLTIYEFDTGKVRISDGTSWWTTASANSSTTSFESPMYQGVSFLGSPVSVRSRVFVSNGICDWWFQLKPLLPGTAGSPITLRLPYNAVNVAPEHIGAGMYFRSAASVIYTVSFEIINANTIGMAASTGGTNNQLGATPSFAAAANDEVRGHVRFLLAAAA